MSDLALSLSPLAVFTILVTGTLLVVTNDWRLSFLALGLQYLAAATLAAQVVDWPVVAVRTLVGLLVTVILIVTGRQAHFGRRVKPPDPLRDDEPEERLRFDFPTNFPFRLVAALMTIVAAGYLGTEAFPALAGLPAGPNLATILLIALALVNLGLTEEPMSAGIGLLTLLTGFGLAYAAMESSLAVVALLAAVDFGVALAASHLALTHYGAGEREAPV